MVTQKLIERCMRQERPAQFELYTVLYPLMMSICTRYERNRQDATARMNNGFLKVLQNLGTRRPEVPFNAWVSRIIINSVIDDFRRDRTRLSLMISSDVPDQYAGSEANEYLAEMESEDFAELLNKVPDMSRQVFNLFAIDGHPHAEIAERLGISEGTSKWHVNNARMILRKALVQQRRALEARTTVQQQHSQ